MNELVAKIFKRLGVMVPGHFVFRSGRHATTYLDKDAIYASPCDLSTIAGMLAEPFIDHEIDTIVGAEKGGIVLASRTAEHLSDRVRRDIASVYAEKDHDRPGAFGFSRGYHRYVIGKKVGIVEDNVTKGGTIRALGSLITRLGGTIVGGAVICTRGDVKAEDVGFPFLVSLLNLDIPDFEPGKATCPGCAADIPFSTQFGRTKILVTEKEKGNV